MRERAQEKLRPIIPDDEVVISDGMKYSVRALIEIAETSPTMYLTREQLQHTIDGTCWDDNNGAQLRPADVIAIFNNFLPTNDAEWEQLKSAHPNLSTHIERIRKADTSKPILAVDMEGELVVLDGMHRLARLFLEGNDSISAKKFDGLPSQAVVTN